jgi:hypothetical protein
MAGTRWPPEPGETVGIARSARALLDFDARITRVGDSVIRTISRRYPGMKVNRKRVKPAWLAAEVRDDVRGGVVVEVIDYTDSNGNIRVIGVSLGWDSRLHVPRPLPWE